MLERGGGVIGCREKGEAMCVLQAGSDTTEVALESGANTRPEPIDR